MEHPIPQGPVAKIEHINNLKDRIIGLFKTEGLSDGVKKLTEEWLDEYQIALRTKEFGSSEKMVEVKIDMAILYANTDRIEKALEILEEVELQAGYIGSENIFKNLDRAHLEIDRLVSNMD